MQFCFIKAIQKWFDQAYRTWLIVKFFAAFSTKSEKGNYYINRPVLLVLQKKIDYIVFVVTFLCKY